MPLTRDKLAHVAAGLVPSDVDAPARQTLLERGKFSRKHVGGVAPAFTHAANITFLTESSSFFLAYNLELHNHPL